MAIAVAREIVPPTEIRQETYLNHDYSIKSWLLTRDHKRIAVMYLISITIFFLLAGVFAILFRVFLSAGFAPVAAPPEDCATSASAGSCAVDSPPPPHARINNAPAAATATILKIRVTETS